MNTPTKITFLRILLIPIFLLCFYLDFWGHYFVSTILIIVCGITDMVDGALARKNNQVTTLGKFLDPIADKVMAIAAMIALISLEQDTFFRPYGAILSIIMISREILIGMFRTVAAKSGIVLSADKLGKLKTIFTNVSLPMMIYGATQFEYYGNEKLRLSGVYFAHIGFALFIIAFVLSVLSGINYVVKNKQVFEEIK